MKTQTNAYPATPAAPIYYQYAATTTTTTNSTYYPPQAAPPAYTPPRYQPQNVYAPTDDAMNNTPPNDKVKQAYCLAGVVFLMFLIAYICCAALIPWPDPYGTTLELAPNAQETVFANGEFSESMIIGGVGPDLYTFDQPPSLSAVRSFQYDYVFKPDQSPPGGQNFYAEEHAYLRAQSTVLYSWTYNGDCPLVFQIIRGAHTANAYFNGQTITPEVRIIFTSSQSTAIQFSVSSDDTYYFVFSNEAAVCTNSQDVDATIEMEARTYDLTSAVDICHVTVATCVKLVPYPNDQWYLIFNSHGNDSSVIYYVYGRWWAYTLLYTGLFFGMSCCTGILCNRAKRIHRRQVYAVLQ